MLTGKQRRYLRGLGHALEPIVQLGKAGLTDGVVGAVNAALLDHELIKVKLAQVIAPEQEDLAPALAERCKAELVGAVGHVLLYYKRHPHEPKIVLPKPTRRAAAAPPADDDE